MFVTQNTFGDRIGRELGNFQIKSYKRKIIYPISEEGIQAAELTVLVSSAPPVIVMQDCFQRDNGSLTNFARISTCMNALINTNRHSSYLQTIFGKEFSSDVPE